MPSSLIRTQIFLVCCGLLLHTAGCLLFSADRRGNLKRAPNKAKAEFFTEIRDRNIQHLYSEHLKYITKKLSQTRRSDKYRIPWIEDLVNDPLEAPLKAEEFTVTLYNTSIHEYRLSDTFRYLYGMMSGQHQNEKVSGIGSYDDDPFSTLSTRLVETKQAVNRSFGRISKSERMKISQTIHSVTTLEATFGFRFGGPDKGAGLIDLLGRINFEELNNSGIALASTVDPVLLTHLKDYYRTVDNRSVRRELQTPAGMILVGGDGPNTYNLDESMDVVAVVDFGGDDIYLEGGVHEARPALVIIDFSGNDVYRGVKPGIQGGAIMGASLLYDQSGDDRYEGVDVAQGSAMCGVGILIDHAGNDVYTGDRRVQGQAINGFGILIDRSGNDRYRAALFAQGHGGPLGAGVLVEGSGDDHYFAGGKYPDSYEDSPGFGSWSQGIGAGARDVANGGLGILLDGAGDDAYQADYFSHGGGYWLGAGFVRDFQGDDQRMGATRSNFDGSPRTVHSFLRWSTGFGAHYAAGFVFDDQGNDLYSADWAAIAYGWDIGGGFLFDGGGNDCYLSRGSGVAEGRNGGFAILYDSGGRDRYLGNGLGTADKRRDLLSFALLLDEGGQDTFNQSVSNRTRLERGWNGGLFIDR